MNWWQIIVGTVIGTLGIVFVRGTLRERRGLPWRTTLGKVTEFEGYIEETDDGWPCPSARIKFRYEVNGAEYFEQHYVTTGDFFYVCRPFGSHRGEPSGAIWYRRRSVEEINELAQAHRSGKSIQVYYDPAKPTNFSFSAPGPWHESLIFGIYLVCISLSLIFWRGFP